MEEMALGELGAIKFIEDPTLLDDGDPVVIVRTWKERLFSRPWKPFVKTKTIIPQVPSKYVYFAERSNGSSSCYHEETEGCYD